MDAATHLDHLRADIDRILLTPETALAAPVTACPEWTVTDLLGHHAGVFAFAIAQLRAEPGSELVPFDPPPDGPALDVFSTTARELLTALEDTDPNEHRPSWAGAPTAAFYWRRMAQETAVHRFDIEAAYAVPGPIDVALALDGIDEFGDVFLRHAKRRGITGDGETVHLHATDPEIPDRDIRDGAAPGGEWMFTFTPDGVEIEHAHGKGDMAGRGSASDLLLMVWNRRPIDVQTFGRPDLLEWWSRNVRI